MDSNGRVVLTAQAILAAVDLEMEWVAIPEWAPRDADPARRAKHGVYVRAITAGERESLLQGNLTITRSGERKIDVPQFRVRLAAMAMVDEAGGRIFSNHQVEDLKRKTAKAIDRVADVAQRLGGIEDDATDETAAKNGDAQGAPDEPNQGKVALPSLPSGSKKTPPTASASN
jgi:hypothetical protein